MESAIDVAAAAAAASLEGGAWCPREAEWGPGVAAADVDVAVDGPPRAVRIRHSDVGVRRRMWTRTRRRGSRRRPRGLPFPCRTTNVFAALVMSFMSEISLICKGGGRRASRRLAPDMDGGRPEGQRGAHEALAAKDVGEEARGILDVRATLGADHLLPVLVIDTRRFCETRTSTATIQHQL